jgi:hypothetical protein
MLDTASSRVVDRYFIPAPGPWSAWLLYRTATGEGVGLVVGPLRPGTNITEQVLALGVAEVDAKFQPLLLLHGPPALRWNGKALVVNGQ